MERLRNPRNIFAGSQVPTSAAAAGLLHESRGYSLRSRRSLWFDECGMKVKCPKCGKESAYAGNPFRPFCDERCKLIDLGDWMKGSYSLPAVKDEEEDGLPESSEETGDS